MSEVYFQGKFYPADEAVVPITNRAFHFGDGFFETIRVVNGRPCFLNSHFMRIRVSMDALKMTVPHDFNEATLFREITRLLERNGIHQGGRVRITFSRKADGFYLPLSNDTEYLIEAYPTNHNLFTLNQQGRVIDIYPEMKKQINALSAFKTLNCQLYIMACLYAKSRNLDDCFIQNDRHGIIEASSSNIFIVSNGVLYTPSLEEGCVGGVMRMQLINLAIDHNIKVYECNLSPQNLLAADEIFLTNAIQGVQWVSSYRTKRYFNEMSRRMLQILNDHVKQLHLV